MIRRHLKYMCFSVPCLICNCSLTVLSMAHNQFQITGSLVHKAVALSCLLILHKNFLTCLFQITNREIFLGAYDIFIQCRTDRPNLCSQLAASYVTFAIELHEHVQELVSHYHLFCHSPCTFCAC